MSLTVTLLGTGTSTGMPLIGCDCAACRSDDPRDRRDRPGAMVRIGDGDEHRVVLIDTPTELRHQVIGQRLRRVDAVVYTHNHADHVFGLDDLRTFNAIMRQSIDIYGEAAVIEWIRQTFRYIFEPRENVNQSWVPQLVSHAIDPDRPLELAGRTWTPIRLMHGQIPILGYRVGRFAYCTDCSHIPPESMELLQGLDMFVIDGLRHRPHPTHLTVEQALEIIDQLRPARAYLTHIAHDIVHAELQAELPENVFVAYDGLTVEVEEAKLKA